MAAKAASIALLREVADAVEQIGEARVRQALKAALPLEARGGSVPLRATSAKKVARSRRTAPVRQELIEKSLQNLTTVRTREEGLERIRNANFSRRELEVLARVRTR